MGFDYSKYTQSGDYVKFENPGDHVVGTIKSLQEGKDFNGNPCPLIILEVDDEGTEKTLTAGQVMLKAELAEKQPQEGDRVRITYTGPGEARPGKAPAKLFTVDVKKGPHELVNAAVSNTDDPF